MHQNDQDYTRELEVRKGITLSVLFDLSEERARWARSVEQVGLRDNGFIFSMESDPGLFSSHVLWGCPIHLSFYFEGRSSKCSNVPTSVHVPMLFLLPEKPLPASLSVKSMSS